MKSGVYMLLIVTGLLISPPTAAQEEAPEESFTGEFTASRLMEATTGINPDHYPCAKARLISLYQKRQEIGDLSAYHPKRMWNWLTEHFQYYTDKVIDFFKRLFSMETVRSTVKAGMDQIEAVARSGDPMGAAQHKLDSAVYGVTSQFSLPSQYALRRKMEGVISATTNSDGSCK